MLCVRITGYGTSCVSGEWEWSGGNFVIYGHHSRVVTALSLLLSEPPISREMGSEHPISDTLFIWVDTEQQTLRPWGFQEVKATRFQDSRHMKVVWLSALLTGRLYPPGNIPGTNFYWRLSQPQGHSSAGRIMSMKNSSDTIGNRTRDLRACSAVPQPPAPPRTPEQILNTTCSHCPIAYISERFSNSSLQTLIIPLPCAWNYHTASRPRRDWSAGSTQFEPLQQPPIEQEFQGGYLTMRLKY
jgi:hypothetical protein